MRRRLINWGGGILALILIATFVLAYFIDEPLRRRVEREMNARLKGYTIRIEKLDFHPIGLSLDLEKLWIYQTPQPDPPIAYIPICTPAFIGKHFFLDDWWAIFN